MRSLCEEEIAIADLAAKNIPRIVKNTTRWMTTDIWWPLNNSLHAKTAEKQTNVHDHEKFTYM